MTDLERPTDEELAALIKPVWLKAKPTHEAQGIRAVLSTEFDDPRWEQWVSDFIPDYVWDLVDIAAQRGMSDGYDAANCGVSILSDALEAISLGKIVAGTNRDATQEYARVALVKAKAALNPDPPVSK